MSKPNYQWIERGAQIRTDLAMATLRVRLLRAELAAHSAPKATPNFNALGKSIKAELIAALKREFPQQRFDGDDAAEAVSA